MLGFGIENILFNKFGARPKPPYPFFRLDKGGVREIEKFKRSKNGVLFAAGALWEGIDIPGNALSMLIKLKQGFGRLIRSESDTGVVAILDSRAAANGAYRDAVIDTLPACRVTSEIEDVESFMCEKKSAEYFN